jgi:hypothetical protein
MGTILPLLIGTFTTPEKIGMTPQSMLWLLPLVISIAVVYKATKVPKITMSFLKETVVLVGSIIIFIGVAALVLYTLAWIIIG